MEVLFYISSTICYGCLAFLAIEAWRRMRRQQMEIDDMAAKIDNMFFVTKADHIQSNFDRIAKMRKILKRLVRDEEFDEAAKLKNLIGELEQRTLEDFKRLQEEFGDGCIEMGIIKVPKH